MSDSTFKLALSLTLGLTWVIEIWAARTMSPGRRLIVSAVIRRFGWAPALLGLIGVAVPYYNPVLGVLLLGPSLLVAVQNLDRVWLACALGEEEYRAILLRAAASRRLPLALVGSVGAGLLLALAGGDSPPLELKRPARLVILVRPRYRGVRSERRAYQIALRPAHPSRGGVQLAGGLTRSGAVAEDG